MVPLSIPPDANGEAVGAVEVRFEQPAVKTALDASNAIRFRLEPIRRAK
jgi:hypothetical protein